ncbi:hypothetical protein N9824_00550 [bacterium]|nr:hypothetical protein [bacterium]
MKVSITLTEVITYEITKELDLTSTEYATYIKTGKLPSKKDTELQHELSSEVDDIHHVETEHRISNIDKI